jgi:hypothetical protein
LEAEKRALSEVKKKDPVKGAVKGVQVQIKPEIGHKAV